MNERVKRGSIRAAAVAAALGAAVSVSVAGADSASATVSAWSDCPANTACGFADAGGGGIHIEAGGSQCLVLFNTNPRFSDLISSAWNRTGSAMVMYNWTTVWEPVKTVNPGEQWSVGWWDPANDMIDMICVGGARP
ncbi:peptidase inhibitor family I36 protein [Kitasatospora sp. NPDC004799]|uniref:peptidase inhibitor family I36 protein n=1 Tax=Kitasatospora sp. NPDC004799 TaxID=3154460 RepID=UPI0033B7BB89